MPATDDLGAQASASPRTRVARFADLFHYHVHLRTTSDPGLKGHCSDIHARMADCASAPWLAIGRYAIMPDHVHFFCRAELSAKPLRIFMQKWKQWTSKRIAREIAVAGIDDPGLKESRTLWQEEFFDHVLRSNESYSQKWEYVKVNPIRAGLVKKSDDWPFYGQIE